jgi:serine/threonine protein kinase
MPDRVHSGALSPGTRAGRYEVESFLGAGGMGEIYVARDTVLGRRIALKVLPEGCDRDRITRFIREAKASSALNHPAIVSVHDAGSADGIHFLAMELIDGEPLSEWMRSHHSLTRVAELMAQVADGLACAHAAGIVHRDLKPANIMIGRAGFAKIVDFGVAKLAEQPGSPQDVTAVQTADGLQVGTIAYMSPEQVDGVEVDYRSDVFSFGVVLYELLTHIHPFASSSFADTVHNIVHREASLDTVPPQYRRIIARCLAKEPQARYQSMQDVAHDLRDSFSKHDTTSRRRDFPAWRWIAVSLVAAAAVVAALVVKNLRLPEKAALKGTTPQRSMQRLTNSGKIRSAAMSPDGKFLVYVEEERGLRSLWVKQIATEASTRIESPSSMVYGLIRISPDSNYIYYAAGKPPDFGGSIYQIPILGGEPRVLASGPDRMDFALSPDGRQLAVFRYSPDSSTLVSTDIDGHVERTILTLRDFGQARLPAWSPDGKKIAFVETATRQREQHVAEVVLETRAQRVVASFSPQPIWTMTWLPDGSGTLMSAGGTGGIQIWSVPNNGGAPVRITADVASYFSPSITSDGQSFAAVRGETPRSITVLSVDPDGDTHVVRSGLGDHLSGEVRWIDADHIVYDGVTASVRTLFLIPREGGQAQQIIHGMSAWHPSVSQDGKRLAFISDRSGSPQVWLSDLEENAPKQLTFGGDGAQSVEFSADASSVYYGDRGGAFQVPISGGIPQDSRIYAELGFAVSRDGRWLMSLLHRKAGSRVYLYPLPLAVPPRTFAVPPTSVPYTRFHPSSRSFGFIGLSEDGVHNIYLQNIDGGAPRQITHFDHGNIYAFDWSPNGKWLAVATGEPRADVVIVRNFR